MSAALISGEFVLWAGALSGVLFGAPILVKIMHTVRTEVRKILAAMDGEGDSDSDEEEDNPA